MPELSFVQTTLIVIGLCVLTGSIPVHYFLKGKSRWRTIRLIDGLYALLLFNLLAFVTDLYVCHKLFPDYYGRIGDSSAQVIAYGNAFRFSLVYVPLSWLFWAYRSRRLARAYQDRWD